MLYGQTIYAYAGDYLRCPDCHHDLYQLKEDVSFYQNIERKHLKGVYPVPINDIGITPNCYYCKTKITRFDVRRVGK